MLVIPTSNKSHQIKLADELRDLGFTTIPCNSCIDGVVSKAVCVPVTGILDYMVLEVVEEVCKEFGVKFTGGLSLGELKSMCHSINEHKEMSVIGRTCRISPKEAKEDALLYVYFPNAGIYYTAKK
jgi:hypothetical protein